MFGSKKRQEQGQGQGRGRSGTDEVGAYLARQRVDIDERALIEDNDGVRTTAIVIAVTLAYEVPRTSNIYMEESFTHPPQEWTIQADVRLEGGSSFAATFPMFIDEIGDPPAVRETINVVFDPADRSRVLPVIMWRQQVPGGDAGPLRWRVPATCPNCGASVDQSTESVAAHPACHMCHDPLPCEPLV